MTTPAPDGDLLQRRYEQNMGALAQENPLLAARINADIIAGRDSSPYIAQAGNFGPDIGAYVARKKTT